MDLITAEIYCRENNGHLATITTKEEFDKAAVKAPKFSWIGLKRTAPLVNIWQWPNREITNFTRWFSNEPDNQFSAEDCVVMDISGWRDTNCVSGIFVTLCSRSFTLVKKKKTWDEAIQHCRTHYTDLAFVSTKKQLGYFETLLKKETETDSVWTGLRFLDKKWFWVNGKGGGKTMERPVPLSSQCPIHPYRCGSYNFNTLSWENRNCDERFNFVCYY
ncbi:Aggrecan core protein [Bagarius yarrelli]|uniref:Aggrecan core protein n=1 Tax=Bagarius yarrelli TaxID=175774 RepID=A0A556VXP3_BAGYA|nr:Aggrecan core protein [Bagarius yarrelli]